MEITYTTTHLPIPNIISQLNKMGKLNVLVGKFNPNPTTVKIIKNTDILLANPKYFTKFDKTKIDYFNKLKYLFLMSSGLDWVDIEYAKKRKIYIESAKGSNAVAVSEHAWALALSLAKSLNRRKNYIHSVEIFRKRVGIVGYGAVGKEIAKIAFGFGSKVYYTSSHVLVGKPKLKYLDKNKLLKVADIIFLCIPLNRGTKNYIGVKEFERIKTGAILINTARENLVETKPLLESLKSKKLFGYGIDTDKTNSLFLESKTKLNIIATPHTAYNTKESIEKAQRLAVNFVGKFLKDKI